VKPGETRVCPVCRKTHAVVGKRSKWACAYCGSEGIFIKGERMAVTARASDPEGATYVRRS
jgi:hypothetical protein